MSGQGGDDRGDLRDELRAQIVEAKAQFGATNARIEKRAGRNLFLAIGSGLVFGAVFVVSVFTLPQVFMGLVAIIISVALVELASAFRVSGRRVPRVGVVLGGLTIVAGAAFYGAEGMLHRLRS